MQQSIQQSIQQQSKDDTKMIRQQQRLHQSEQNSNNHLGQENQNQQVDSIQLEQSRVVGDRSIIKILTQEDDILVRLGRDKYQLMKNTKELLIKTVRVRNQMIGVKYMERVQGSVFDGEKWKQMRRKFHQRKDPQSSLMTFNKNNHNEKTQKKIDLDMQQKRLAQCQQQYLDYIEQYSQNVNDYYNS